MASKKSRGALSYLTPWSAVSRAVESIGDAKSALGNTAKAMAQGLPGQAKEGVYPEGDLRNISDSRERFEAMYELHQWTPEDLTKQRQVLRVTKMTAMVMAIVSMAGVMLLAILVPLALSIFLIPVGGMVLIMGLSQAFKHALYEAQIELREFISAREFVSRDDFWGRLLG